MFNIIEKIDENPVLNLIKPYLRNKEAYIIGGYIRDILMNKQSPDLDLVICINDVKEFALNLSEKINAHFIELDNENSIYRLVLEDKINYIDIAKPIENDITKDILRRDLTINAIAYDIKEKMLIDLTGGINDIKNGIIKGISEKNFEDDPLRLLRIFRFAAKTGFEIDESLIKLTKKIKASIHKSAAERINTELMKMFEGAYTDKALLKMDEAGLLTEILPVFNEVKKIPPNSHHHLDLLHHSIETVRQIQLYYENAEDRIKNYLDACCFGAVKRLAYLKAAGFLHDIGKPSCWTIEEETGRHRFIKHDEIGANLAVPILKELKFSKKQAEYIKNLIKYHIYPSGMACAPDVNEKAYMRFYRKTEGYVIDVIILAMADRLSARGEKITQEMVDNNINALTGLLNNYLKIQDTIKPLPKLLDGCDIMEILNIKPSKELGLVIDALKEAQIAGSVNNKTEAEAFVKRFKDEELSRCFGK